jgi:transcription elongation GreA/GreB family factor
MPDLADKIKKKLMDEIALLEHELHNELPKEIKVARAHGDLSENAEYKYAKERQGYVAARLGQLHQRMANLSMLNLNNLPKDRAAYGSRIVVRRCEIGKNRVQIGYSRRSRRDQGADFHYVPHRARIVG